MLSTGDIVSYWKFDEGSGTSVNDSADGNQGTISGAAWVPGRIGSALSFDGNVVTIPDAANLTILDQVSVEAWVKISAFGGGDQNTIIAKWRDSSPDSHNYYLGLLRSGPAIFYVGINGNIYGGASQPLQTNQWYHLAGTYDGAAVKLYVNGVLANSQSAIGTLWTGSTPVYIGASPEGQFPRYFHGLIDEVAVFNEALTDADIQQHYQNGLAVTVADSSGNYTLIVPYNWSGVVTPSKSGYTFTPASRTYTNVLADQAGQDYSATPIFYTISGNAGAGEATLSYVDGITKTAIADSSGNYTFTVSYNWSGVVTPSKAGYDFTPASRTYANVLADQAGQDYSATPIFFTISGNAGMDGATLSYTDDTAKTVVSDGSGNYSFTVSYNWSGVVTPSKAGYDFTPASQTYANVLADQAGQDYTAAPILYTFSGNAGVDGAMLSYTEGTAKTVISNGSGNYTLTVPYNWSGVVTPSKAGYTFTPASRTYASVLADQAGQDYSATPIFYTISGNAGVGEATLSYVDGITKTAVADSSGNYTFTVWDNWSGVATPSKAGYTFTPVSRTYANVLADQAGQDYSATPIFYTISGNAGLDEATLSYTDGTPKTVTADSSGNYSLAVSYNWSGVVTPSKAGYTFTPASQTYANVLADQARQDYTAAPIFYTISGNAGVGRAMLSTGDIVSYWKFDEGSGTSVNDSADGNQGTISGAAWVPGRIGSALSFDGNVVTIPDAANLTILDQVSVEAWVKISAFGGGDQNTIIAKWRDSSPDSHNYYLGLLRSGPAIFYVGINGNIYGGASQPLQTNQWYHLAGTYDGAAVKLYVNGVLANSQSAIGTLWTGSTPVYIGASPEGQFPRYFHGLIDEVAVFNEALTDADIQQHYQNGLAVTVADSSGNYTLTVPYNWSGVVTPSKPGYTFTPASRTYANVLTNLIDQNYVAKILLVYLPLLWK